MVFVLCWWFPVFPVSFGFPVSSGGPCVFRWFYNMCSVSYIFLYGSAFFSSGRG